MQKIIYKIICMIFERCGAEEKIFHGALNRFTAHSTNHGIPRVKNAPCVSDGSLRMLLSTSCCRITLQDTPLPHPISPISQMCLNRVHACNLGMGDCPMCGCAWFSVCFSTASLARTIFANCSKPRYYDAFVLDRDSNVL